MLFKYIIVLYSIFLKVPCLLSQEKVNVTSVGLVDESQMNELFIFCLALTTFMSILCMSNIVKILPQRYSPTLHYKKLIR